MKQHLKKIYDIIAHISYVLPFLAFCIGYFCLQFFITDHTVQAPDLIGKDILQATKICSNLKLNLRIIAEKEMVDATPGTIITQNPLQQTLIKSHQSIFIVVTKLPDPIMAPTLIGKNIEQIEKLCAEQAIKHRAYFLPSKLPTGHCFAQMPTPDQPLQAKKISSYIAAGTESLYLFPDFTDMPLGNVINFLQEQNINFDIFCKDQKLVAPYKKSYTISYQKPLAGSLITPNNKLYVQLQVV